MKFIDHKKSLMFFLFLVNCWPNETPNGGCDVNIEYELQNTNLVLKDVQISVPLP